MRGLVGIAGCPVNRSDYMSSSTQGPWLPKMSDRDYHALSSSSTYSTNGCPCCLLEKTPAPRSLPLLSTSWDQPPPPPETSYCFQLRIAAAANFASASALGIDLFACTCSDPSLLHGEDRYREKLRNYLICFCSSYGDCWPSFPGRAIATAFYSETTFIRW